MYFMDYNKFKLRFYIIIYFKPHVLENKNMSSTMNSLTCISILSDFFSFTS